MRNDNNLNFLRIFFSLSVLAYHCFALSQSNQINFLSHFFNPDLAVQGFFIVSGYLIFKSYNRSNSIKAFYFKRIRRIYPAYVTVIFLSAILGVFISKFSPSEYFRSSILYKYLLYNSVFMNFFQQSLPGVFIGNHLNAVNGALWTLKIEVGFYLIVPLLMFLRKRFNKHVFYNTLIILSLIYYLTTLHFYNVTHKDIYLFISRQLPGQLFFFLMGAYLTEFEDIPLFRNIIRIVGLPCVFLLAIHPGIFWETIALAGAVFFIGFVVPPFWYPFKKEDISYGLYIYHFPIIQALIYLQVYSQSPILGVLLSFVFTIFMAALSWVFIEKPFIMNNRINFYNKKIKADNPVTSS